MSRGETINAYIEEATDNCTDYSIDYPIIEAHSAFITSPRFTII